MTPRVHKALHVLCQRVFVFFAYLQQGLNSTHLLAPHIKGRQAYLYLAVNGKQGIIVYCYHGNELRAYSLLICFLLKESGLTALLSITETAEQVDFPTGLYGSS